MGTLRRTCAKVPRRGPLLKLLWVDLLLIAWWMFEIFESWTPNSKLTFFTSSFKRHLKAVLKAGPPSYIVFVLLYIFYTCELLVILCSTTVCIGCRFRRPSSAVQVAPRVTVLCLSEHIFPSSLSTNVVEFPALQTAVLVTWPAVTLPPLTSSSPIATDQSAAATTVFGTLVWECSAEQTTRSR